ncbi:uncharacterized protein MELLADRAFT_77132 [Melampsora larici-populina 98AG31]|uniref:Uncharacterized protein n=1 Tax=Melampsora larici-populina (strain 98AG31 / pathotype 3-4-7) TaxID=747676 RepID=F4RDQ6_MELLP|nr:uncharacterized protein MELLADRAFT_77132 [Melampsora larici-populina 98AG31]EGG09440.1 hypothetical protein MELLADRAFT_77132 [Melampsora larici-populina 98AG31]
MPTQENASNELNPEPTSTTTSTISSVFQSALKSNSPTPSGSKSPIQDSLNSPAVPILAMDDSFITPSSDPESPLFVLHRRLHHRNIPGFNQVVSEGNIGVDVFTTNVCKLDKAALQAVSHNTDIVQVHYPVTLDSVVPIKPVLSDVVPTPPSQSSSNSARLPTNGITPSNKNVAQTQTTRSTSKSNVPKMPAKGPHGPPGMKFSSYGSKCGEADAALGIRICYSCLTLLLAIFFFCSAARFNRNRQRLNHWIHRPNRYFDIPAETLSMSSAELKSLTSSEGLAHAHSRKRQKMAIDMQEDDAPEESTSALDTDHTHEFINSRLATNNLLIRNLQERQFERLREVQDTDLDPSLSSTSSAHPVAPASSKKGDKQAPGLSSTELAEADRLMKSLSELLELRPQVSTHIPGSAHDALSIVPSREQLRRTQNIIMQSRTKDDPTPVYQGCLPSVYAVGIKESVLTSQPDARLVEILTKKPMNGELNGNNGSIPAIASHNFPTPPSRLASSTPFAYRDPALLQLHPSQLQANFRTSLPEHMKMNSFALNGGSIPQTPSMPGNLMHSSNQSPTVHAHHHLVQSQRPVAGPQFRGRPGMPVSSPQIPFKHPNLTTPNLNDHPNHRALASIPMHSPFNTTPNRIV